MEWLATFFDTYGALLAEGTWDSIVMTSISVLIAYVIGVPVGVLVTLTAPGGLHPNRPVNTVLGWIVNVGRSVPFIILLFALILRPSRGSRRS